MRLRKWRKEAKVSIQEISKETQIPPTTLYHYDSGKVLPSLINWRKISKLTKGEVTIEDFIEDFEEYKEEVKSAAKENKVGS